MYRFGLPTTVKDNLLIASNKDTHGYIVMHNILVVDSSFVTCFLFWMEERADVSAQVEMDKHSTAAADTVPSLYCTVRNCVYCTKTVPIRTTVPWFVQVQGGVPFLFMTTGLSDKVQ